MSHLYHSHFCSVYVHIYSFARNGGDFEAHSARAGPTWPLTAIRSKTPGVNPFAKYEAANHRSIGAASPVPGRGARAGAVVRRPHPHHSRLAPSLPPPPQAPPQPPPTPPLRRSCAGRNLDTPTPLQPPTPPVANTTLPSPLPPINTRAILHPAPSPYPKQTTMKTPSHTRPKKHENFTRNRFKAHSINLATHSITVQSSSISPLPNPLNNPTLFEPRRPCARINPHGRSQVLGRIQQDTRHRQGPLRRPGSLLRLPGVGLGRRPRRASTGRPRPRTISFIQSRRPGIDPDAVLSNLATRSIEPLTWHDPRYPRPPQSDLRQAPPSSTSAASFRSGTTGASPSSAPGSPPLMAVRWPIPCQRSLPTTESPSSAA